MPAAKFMSSNRGYSRREIRDIIPSHALPDHPGSDGGIGGLMKPLSHLFLDPKVPLDPLGAALGRSAEEHAVGEGVLKLGGGRGTCAKDQERIGVGDIARRYHKDECLNQGH